MIGQAGENWLVGLGRIGLDSVKNWPSIRAGLAYGLADIPWRNSSSGRFCVGWCVKPSTVKKKKTERNACFCVTLGFPNYERSKYRRICSYRDRCQANDVRSYTHLEARLGLEGTSTQLSQPVKIHKTLPIHHVIPPLIRISSTLPCPPLEDSFRKLRPMIK